MARTPNEQEIQISVDRLKKLHFSGCFKNEPLNYVESDIDALITGVKKIFAKELALVEINPPCTVVGDIHGQYADLVTMFEVTGLPHQNESEKSEKIKMKASYKQKYVFMGDYVDRGSFSVECIIMLFLLKFEYPDYYMLLRGNHECSSINKVYGFYDEIMTRFQNGEYIYSVINETFDLLPLAALIGTKILCMHGGISPRLRSLDEIRRIEKPLPEPMTHELATDLLWADPMVDLEGFHFNGMRGVSVFFGEDTVLRCQKKLGIQLIVRAHQVMKCGFAFFARRRLVTLFSAPKYMPDRENRAAVMRVATDGKISFIVMQAGETAHNESEGKKEFQDELIVEEENSSYTWNQNSKNQNKPKKIIGKSMSEQSATGTSSITRTSMPATPNKTLTTLSKQSTSRKLRV